VSEKLTTVISVNGWLINTMYSPESFVDRSVPAHKGAWCEQDKPEYGQTKRSTSITIHDKIR